MPYPFLSDQWLEEVQKLAAESGGGMMPDTVELNMVVTGGPEGDKELHVAKGAFATGLLDSAPTNKDPRIGPVQENETIARVSAIKNIPAILEPLDFEPAVFETEPGSVISK